MLVTTKECHVLFDLLVQESNSEIKRTIPPESKDLYLNTALLSWIKTRSNSKTNFKKEGLFQSVKRIDDLQSLERTTPVSSLYVNDVRSVFSVLPYDYMSYVTSVVGTRKDCTGNTLPAQVASNLKYILLPIGVNIPISSGVLIQINGINILTPATYNSYYPIPLTLADSVFISVNFILQYINNLNNGLSIYWERYGDVYKPNNFIIVTEGTLISAHIEYVTTNTTYSHSTTSVVALYGSTKLTTSNLGGTSSVECLLTSAEHIYSILQDSIYNRNMHKNPFIILHNNKLILYHDGKFTLNNLLITYIKYPTLYNVITGSMPEIDKHEEIVDIAVRRYLGSLGDPAYRAIQDEIQVNE